MFLYNISDDISKDGKAAFAELGSSTTAGHNPSLSRDKARTSVKTVRFLCFNLPSCLFLTPSLWGPENQQPQDDRRSEEQRPRCVWMGKNEVKAPKASSLGNWHSPACLKLPGNPHFQGCSLLDLTQKLPALSNFLPCIL